MTDQQTVTNLSRVQSSADGLANAKPEERQSALEDLCQAFLEHFHEPYDSTATEKVLSRGLPVQVQQFAAAWLVRCLTKSQAALQFASIEPLAADLFDRAFQNNIYQRIKTDSRRQTYEKLLALEGHLHTVLSDAEALVSVTPNLGQLNAFLQKLMELLNNRANQPFLTHFLPASLLHQARIADLIQVVTDYAENQGDDPIHKCDAALSACDEFESEARDFGTTDAESIFGGLARQLKSAVADHFESSEAGKSAALDFRPISKKYPLERLEETISFRIKVVNNGTGPARDVRLGEVAADECLRVHTSGIGLGNIQPGETLVFDIGATVVAPSEGATLLAEFSWNARGGRIKQTEVFEVFAQRGDVDWSTVELTEPYSLEPVGTENDLIGRKAELTRLLRLANSKAVGSGFIFGQKRVGKTSLANAVEESLEANSDVQWIVINKGSGDYVGSDATSTLRNMGEVLAQAIKERVPALTDVPTPDFTNGLSPLSRLVDQALAKDDLRILFILDEFDELPPELFRRTDLATSLFQPLRQISNKPGCGFLLVGGESMHQIVNSQGDRLNKFTPVELDYFTKSNNRSDFVELIRRPVQDWLTISEAALDELFNWSAGNPYFAKLLARQLFADMVDNRYSDASEVDMGMAIEHTLSSIGGNSFAHFWTDGLAQSPDNAEEIRITRRSVLIAAGRAFRKQSTVNYETIREEFKNAAGSPVEEQRFQTTLQDFVIRKILVEDEAGNVSPKIPLFRSWLMDKGVGDLLENSRELDYLRSRLQDEEKVRVSDSEISQLSGRLANFRYRGRPIENIAIRTWLEQFDGSREQRLMFRLASGIRSYDEDQVRSKMREAFGIVMRNMRTVIEPRTRVRNDILVSPLDDSPAKSGATYCRIFASENRISTQSFHTLESLERRFPINREVQRLVLIDDFSGTGATLVSGLDRHLDLLKRMDAEGIRVIVIALVGFTQARDHIEHYLEQAGLGADVYFCDELGPEDRAFSESSSIFPDPAERDLARQIVENKGVTLERRFPLGYKDTQGLIVFSQSCPNNTLPIFWSKNGSWVPLFPRV